VDMNANIILVTVNFNLEEASSATRAITYVNSDLFICSGDTVRFFIISRYE
jgi:hypothetical protein